MCPLAGPFLAPVEKALWEDFIPCVLRKPGFKIDNKQRRLFANRVKRGGLGIRNPTVAALDLHAASKEVTEDLVEALIGGGRA